MSSEPTDLPAFHSSISMPPIRIIIPPEEEDTQAKTKGNGEFVYDIVSKLSQLLKHEINLSDLGSLVIDVCCQAINAETGEFLLNIDNKLEMLSDGKYCNLQGHIYEIDETSFPGYVAHSRKTTIINNVKVNQLYNSCKNKIHPFKDHTVLLAHSVIGVPLLNENQELVGVIQMFNKTEKNL